MPLLACLSLGAPRAKTHPRLFFGPEDMPGIRVRLESPQGRAIADRLNGLLAKNASGPELGQIAAGWALRYAWLGDKQACEKALQVAETAASECSNRLVAGKKTQGPDLPLLRGALGLAVAYDLCSLSWPLERRMTVAQTLVHLSQELVSPQSDKSTAIPISATVLENAVGGLAGLTLLGDPGAPSDLAVSTHTARTQVERYLASLGDKGWGREGFGELRQAVGQGLGAFLLAWRHSQGDDLATPSAAHWWASLYATLLLPPQTPGGAPELPYYGLARTSDPSRPEQSWETGPAQGGDVAAVLAISDAASRAALQWSFERCLGEQGSRTYDITKPSDVLFVILGLPAGDTTLAPATIFPRAYTDEQAGLIVLRNRWNGYDDSVASIYANARPIPGRASYADAGSFRLLALGGRWAIQRQKDRNDLLVHSRERENVVLIPGTHGYQPGHATRVLTQPDGSGLVTLNLDPAYTVAPLGASPRMLEPTQDLGIRVTRSWAVDYSGACGAPVLLAVLDQVRNGPTRRWLMHTAERDIKIVEDGFELRAANGATLKATVVLPGNPRLSIDRGEWTDTLAIDGEGDFFVIMTVEPANTPHPAVNGRNAGLDSILQIGGARLRFDGTGLAIQ